MKKIIFSLLATLLLFSCVSGTKTLVVSNPTNTERRAEMVEVNVSDLKVCFNKKGYILKNEVGEEVPYQLVYNGEKKPLQLIFQADVKANNSITYILSKGEPSVVKPKTYACYVPERKDDFAWENDLAAYRMYGPALAKENPSNGVDVWLKRTDELVIEKRYYDELHNKKSYHTDFGTGLDCYKVGHTLGAGGIAPFVSDKLWIGNHYDSFKIIEVGPLRSVFSLTYDSVIVGKNTYKQTITITTTAGSIMNKAVVRYEGKEEPMKLAAGIFLHDGEGTLKENSGNGIITYGEDAISEFGVPSGRSYVGIMVPTDGTESRKVDSHAVLLTDYTVGKEFTYYFGAGWNKWGFNSDIDWYKSVLRFGENIKSPMKVTVK